MDTIPNNLIHLIKMKYIILYVLVEFEALKVVEYLEANGIDAVNVEGGMHAWGDSTICKIKSI